MKSRLFSDARRRVTWLATSLTMCLSAWGHPDLLLQIAELDEDLSRTPADTSLLVQRGDLYRRHGDYESAKRDFDAARALQSAPGEVDFLEGKLALESGNPDRAAELLNRYLVQHPQHAAGWLVMGDIEGTRGDSMAAAQNYAMALARSARPTPDLYMRQARSLANAGSDHAGEAMVVLNLGLEQFPQDVSLLGLATDISLDRGDSEEAARFINSLPQAIRKLPQWKHREDSLKQLLTGSS